MSGRFGRSLARRALVVLVVALLLPCMTGCDDPVVGAYLVRHAEKLYPFGDPPLSAQGQQRAEDLAAELADKGISGIITSQYLRTQQTAQPLADLLGIEPVVIAATDIDGIVSYVWTHHEGDVVLIVGHDNTVPDIIGELGAVPPVDPIPADEYDKLFILIAVGENAAVAMTEYGDPSPPPGR